MIRTRSIAGIVFLAIVGIFALTLIFPGSFWYRVDEGERAVITTNGAFSRVDGPGLHFKAPIFQAANWLDHRQRVLRWDDNGKVVTGDFAKMQAYSFDQQPADFRVSVNYRIPEGEAEAVYRTYQTVDNVAERVIARRLPSIIKTVFGQFTAVSVIQERAKFNAAISDAVSSQLDGPIVIDSVQVEDIAFSDAFEQAIEARMLAQVEVEKRNQDLRTREIDARITVVNAQAEADALLAKATANAKGVQLAGQAQAEAIKARATALGQNPLLVQLTLAERWDGAQPRMWLGGGGNGNAPAMILNLPSEQQK